MVLINRSDRDRTFSSRNTHRRSAMRLEPGRDCLAGKLLFTDAVNTLAGEGREYGTIPSAKGARGGLDDRMPSKSRAITLLSRRGVSLGGIQNQPLMGASKPARTHGGFSSTIRL